MYSSKNAKGTQNILHISIRVSYRNSKSILFHEAKNSKINSLNYAEERILYSYTECLEISKTNMLSKYIINNEPLWIYTFYYNKIHLHAWVFYQQNKCLFTPKQTINSLLKTYGKITVNCCEIIDNN